MTFLYNCRHDGDQYRITKFDSDFNVEASYLLDASNCDCPAGHRPSCRHRQMLPKFIARNAVGTDWFWDHDRGGWVQGWQEPSPEPSLDEIENIDWDRLAEERLGQSPLAPEGLGQASDPETSLDRVMGADVDSWVSLEQALSPFVDVPKSVELREGLKYPTATKTTIRGRI